MSLDPRIEQALATHPCYNEDAHRTFARMHIPVAPRCNIQCNYCNRKFDCCNESRPGVTSELLTPEQALEKIRYVKERIPNLSVIGIAGPGDPLANEETFQTLELIGKQFPELTLCVSTNGLALPDNARRLYGLGVRFVTVTMNASNPETGSKIYSHVIFKNEHLSGEEGALTLLYRQTEGIRLCAELGMAVKVNIVMIPGINDEDIPILVKKVKALGAYMVNILPLIPVQGTAFSDLRAPTPAERKAMMDRCELDARMMRHCRQCRADAIGLLGEDRSQEFVQLGGCGSGCGPSPALRITGDRLKAAVAIDASGRICGFGSASSFRVYSLDSSGIRQLRDIPVDRTTPVSGDDHKIHIVRILESLSGCGRVIVREIGELPSRMLSESDIEIVLDKGDPLQALERLAR